MDDIYSLETPGRGYGTPEEATHSFRDGYENEEYTTSINELISEAGAPSATEYFLATLFKLSEYLFQKKTNTSAASEMEISFDEYLNSVSNEISIYDTLHKRAKRGIPGPSTIDEDDQHESELLECYRRVPYIYFQNKFVLDFGDLQKGTHAMRLKQEKLNDDLDLVEINLFSQIHFKFHEYFKVVANFDYLSQSLVLNLAKVKEARARVNKVKVDFLDKSVVLRKKIQHRQNLERTIKLLKIIKSLKKLPSIIKQILESSLPYECLSLLRSTKDSLSQTNGLKCVSKTSQSIRESESLVQMGLNKRYADQLYLYLQECQKVNLQENWDRINTHNCMDLSMNGSFVGGNHSQFLEESFLEMQPTSSKNKRQEGKEYEIAMILLQSYRFINFPADLTRIKISNSIRVFSKRFDAELAACLNAVLELKTEQKNASPQMDQAGLTADLVEKVTVTFYVKHLYIYNEIMKETLDRFFGYLQTLLMEYNESAVKEEAKFVELFKEELTIIPTIGKIIMEKLKSLMSLKNINGSGLPEFKQWLGLFDYWQKYFDNLVDESPLVNYDGPVGGLEESISDTFRKTLQLMNINPTINELSLGFITSFHNNVLSAELHPSLIDESWQSVEIPNGFMEVLNNVSQWQNPRDEISGNISITILNESSDKSLGGLNRSTLSAQGDSKGKTEGSKFRVLKNNILIDGHRFKVSLSLLLLIEFLEEYVKMGRALKSCQKIVYERMFDLIDNYNLRSKELILDAKARKYEKMKAKNISAKHLCLLHNCLTVLLKLLAQMDYPEMKEFLSLTVDGLLNHQQKLLEKLANLLRTKVESTINTYLTGNSSEEATSNSLLNVLVQMMAIIDEYLVFENRREVFREAMHLFVTRYFKELLLKGKALLGENKILVEKMRFLRQYFPEELDVMEKQLHKMQIQ